MRWCFDSLYPCGWWMEQLVIVVGAHPRKVITFRSLILMSLNSAAWPPKIGDFSVNAPNNNSNRIYIAPWCSEDTEALELTWVYCMSTPTTLAVTTVVARHTIIIIIIHSNSNYKEIYPFITSFIHVTWSRDHTNLATCRMFRKQSRCRLSPVDEALTSMRTWLSSML